MKAYFINLRVCASQGNFITLTKTINQVDSKGLF